MPRRSSDLCNVPPPAPAVFWQACILREKGLRVSIYERYQDIRTIPSTGRSINLVRPPWQKVVILVPTADQLARSLQSRSRFRITIIWCFCVTGRG